METINPDFEKELQQLRQRLEEAEDVRRAITSGEVDRLKAALERQSQNRAETAVRRGTDTARAKGKKPA